MHTAQCQKVIASRAFKIPLCSIRKAVSVTEKNRLYKTCRFFVKMFVKYIPKSAAEISKEKLKAAVSANDITFGTVSLCKKINTFGIVIMLLIKAVNNFEIR